MFTGKSLHREKRRANIATKASVPAAQRKERSVQHVFLLWNETNNAVWSGFAVIFEGKIEMQQRIRDVDRVTSGRDVNVEEVGYCRTGRGLGEGETAGEGGRVK